MESEEYIYPGDELELFSNAINWKNYFASRLTKYIHGNVLEVGAGNGSTTNILLNQNVSNWMCLEPDKELFFKLKQNLHNNNLTHNIALQNGRISSIKSNEFDCIAYIDVLEHINEDKEEVLLASDLLSRNGNLVILSPAYNWLFSPFDTSIGHVKRYNYDSLIQLESKHLKLVHYEYLDSVGIVLNLLNKFLLKQHYPTKKQIKIWDSFVVPLSRIIDPFVARSFGKTIIGIYRKII